MTIDLLDFGRVLKPHGVRGELRVALLCDGPEAFCLLAETGLARLRGPDQAPDRPASIVAARPHGSIMLVRIEGCESMNDAEALRGAFLSIRPHDLPPAEQDTWYFHQLEGLRVIDPQGQTIGAVERIEDNPAHPMLVVHPAQPDAPMFRIPFVDAFVGQVDLDAGTIQTDLPPGFAQAQR